VFHLCDRPTQIGTVQSIQLSIFIGGAHVLIKAELIGQIPKTVSILQIGQSATKARLQGTHQDGRHLIPTFHGYRILRGVFIETIRFGIGKFRQSIEINDMILKDHGNESRSLFDIVLPLVFTIQRIENPFIGVIGIIVIHDKTGCTPERPFHDPS